MMKDTNALQTLILPAISALGYELLGCVYLSRGRESLLRIYIDHEKGITIGDCQRVSQQVSAVLDVEDPIPGGYTLEVSSPGLDRPLFKREHYQRFIGHWVRLNMQVPIQGQRRFKGLIKTVNEDTVVIEVEGEEITLPLSGITKANLVPTW